MYWFVVLPLVVVAIREKKKTTGLHETVSLWLAEALTEECTHLKKTHTNRGAKIECDCDWRSVDQIHWTNKSETYSSFSLMCRAPKNLEDSRKGKEDMLPGKQPCNSEDFLNGPVAGKILCSIFENQIYNLFVDYYIKQTFPFYHFGKDEGIGNFAFFFTRKTLNNFDWKIINKRSNGKTETSQIKDEDRRPIFEQHMRETHERPGFSHLILDGSLAYIEWDKSDDPVKKEPKTTNVNSPQGGFAKLLWDKDRPSGDTGGGSMLGEYARSYMYFLGRMMKGHKYKGSEKYKDLYEPGRSFVWYAHFEHRHLKELLPCAYIQWEKKYQKKNEEIMYDNLPPELFEHMTSGHCKKSKLIVHAAWLEYDIRAMEFGKV